MKTFSFFYRIVREFRRTKLQVATSDGLPEGLVVGSASGRQGQLFAGVERAFAVQESRQVAGGDVEDAALAGMRALRSHLLVQGNLDEIPLIRLNYMCTLSCCIVAETASIHLQVAASKRILNRTQVILRFHAALRTGCL